MTDWREVKLGDLVKNTIDNRGKNAPLDTEGIIPLLESNLLKAGDRYPDLASASKFVNIETYQNWFRRGHPNPKDVLITTVGNIGKVALMPQDKGCIAQNIIAMQYKEDIDSTFMYYCLSQPNIQSYIQALNISSVQPSIKVGHLYSIPVNIPPLEIQRKIAGVLRALDDKIELNNKINQNLELQAQALFKSWFVDFEPFGGTIPSDWKLYKLGEFLPVITGKKNANVSSSKGKYPFFSCSQDISWTDDYSFEGNAILVAGNGDFNVKFYNGKFEAYQRTYVLIPHNSRYTDWLYYAVKHNLSNITSGARGSVISFITKGNLENFEFAAPSGLDNFNVIDVFSSINKTILNNKKENEKLSTLRDTLLPKLMSGKINVDNVEM